jgi:hypothetical protein
MILAVNDVVIDGPRGLSVKTERPSSWCGRPL